MFVEEEIGQARRVLREDTLRRDPSATPRDNRRVLLVLAYHPRLPNIEERIFTGYIPRFNNHKGKLNAMRNVSLEASSKEELIY